MKFLALLLLLFSTNSWSQNQTVSIKLNTNCTLILERSNFNKANHKFEYYKDNILIAIDGVPLFGTDGEMPKYKLEKATLKVGSKSYRLQTDYMYNPWFGDGPNKELYKIIIHGKDYIIIQGRFSDGAGTYGAEYLIRGNSCFRTILSNDDSILTEYFQQ